jgi:hypothetical protein
MAVEPLAMCYPGPQPGLDADVAKIMDTTLDELRGAGAVLVDVDFTDLIKTALAVRAPLSSGQCLPGRIFLRLDAKPSRSSGRPEWAKR